MIIHGGKGSSNALKEIYLGDLWIYNFVKKNWTEIEYLPKVIKSFHQGCIYGNKMLIFGGKNSDKIH